MRLCVNTLFTGYRGTQLKYAEAAMFQLAPEMKKIVPKKIKMC